MISAASTSPDLTEAGDYFFRVIPSDALQGVFAAELIYEAEHERLAIMYSNEEYGVGLQTTLSAKFSELGGVVIAEAHERGSVDHRTSIAKIKAFNPDAIYIVSNSPDSAVAALKQLKELGVTVKLYGAEGLKSADIIENAGAAAEGAERSHSEVRALLQLLRPRSFSLRHVRRRYRFHPEIARRISPRWLFRQFRTRSCGGTTYASRLHRRPGCSCGGQDVRAASPAVSSQSDEGDDPRQRRDHRHRGSRGAGHRSKAAGCRRPTADDPVSRPRHGAIMDGSTPSEFLHRSPRDARRYLAAC